MDKSTLKLSHEQEEILINLKMHFPFRIVFGVVFSDGKFESYAMNNRRKLNAFAKLNDCSVFELRYK